MPVACLGTRTTGLTIDELPPQGSPIDLVYGEPIVVRAVPFPRRQAEVRAVAADIGETLRTHVQKAVAAIRQPAPGRVGGGRTGMTELPTGYETTTHERADPGPLPVLAIVGRPNVGKSTLVNRIIGRREAVVQDVPGVTRDRVSYDATWSGRQFIVVDTGGWDPDAVGMAAQIAEQAEIAIAAADAVLFVVDATVGITDADEAVVRVLRRSGKPVVLAANKVDDQRGEAEAMALWNLGLGEPYPVSALHGRGSGDLLDAILEALPEAPGRRRSTTRVGRAGWRSSASRTSASPAC